VLALLILALTTNRWVKVLPGLMGIGAMSGLITMFSGHEISHPEIHVSPATGASVALFLAASAIVSSTFVDRALTTVDRCALCGFVICLFWQLLDPRRMLLACGIGMAMLVGAWAYDRFYSNTRGERRMLGKKRPA